MQVLIKLEEQGWQALSSEGEASKKFYSAVLHDDAIMLFPGGMLINGIDGISQKMLTQTLRQLESSGLIHRKVYPVVPAMVEYSLTLLGSTLVEPLKALCRWASKHFKLWKRHPLGVNQGDFQLVGGMAGKQAEEERSQKLTFAAASRATD